MTCLHVLSAWTTAERTNAAGERMLVFERRCYTCAYVEESAAAIVEPHELHYAKVLTGGSEPDD